MLIQHSSKLYLRKIFLTVIAVVTLSISTPSQAYTSHFDFGLFYNLQLSDSATMSTFIEKRFNHGGNSNATSTGFGIGYTARF